MMDVELSCRNTVDKSFLLSLLLLSLLLLLLLLQVLELYKSLKKFLNIPSFLLLQTGVIHHQTNHSWTRCYPLSLATLKLALFRCWPPKRYHRKVKDSTCLAVD